MRSPDPTAPALFDVPAGTSGRVGRAEWMLARAIAAGDRAGLLVTEDAGMIGAALAGARALDVATAMGPKGVYAVAPLMTAYGETLARLRLPAAVAPAEQPRPSAAGDTDPAGALRDLFGTPGA